MGPGYGISKRLGIKPEPNEYTGILIFFALIFLMAVSAPYWAKYLNNLKNERGPREQNEPSRGKYYMPKPHANASGLLHFLR